MRPLPRYTLAVMAAFVAFNVWFLVLGAVLHAAFGKTVPTGVAPFTSLLGVAAPVVVAVALSDYLADRTGLVKPYRPKGRPLDNPMDAPADTPAKDRQPGRAPGRPAKGRPATNPAVRRPE